MDKSDKIIALIKKRIEGNRNREAEIITHRGNMETASAAGMFAVAFEELLKDIDLMLRDE